ncbi:MAG: repressor LexA [Anaerolineae bacterium]|nr:MAG: repressor LexA [Anaerolineae bacterium]
MMARRKREGLTEKHRRVLQVLDTFQEKHGYPPTIREICDRAEISSTSVANYYLDQLEEMGYIERDRGVSRGLRLVQEFRGRFKEAVQTLTAGTDELISLPLLGRIVASEPIPFPTSDFSPFDPESNAIQLAKSMLPGTERNTADLYALEVDGDSMIDAMVNDGDIVIVKRVHEARNGEMVAVWLNDRNETTLKYFYNEGKRIRLQPANPTMKPIYIDDPSTVEIHGKVIMVVRRLENGLHPTKAKTTAPR